MAINKPIRQLAINKPIPSINAVEAETETLKQAYKKLYDRAKNVKDGKLRIIGPAALVLARAEVDTALMNLRVALRGAFDSHQTKVVEARRRIIDEAMEWGLNEVAGKDDKLRTAIQQLGSLQKAK